MDEFRTVNVEIIGELEKANITHPNDMCDLGDVGNLIGVVIAKYFDDNDVGFDKESFISGLNHGISLTDGTHG